MKNILATLSNSESVTDEGEQQSGESMSKDELKTQICDIISALEDCIIEENRSAAIS